MAANEARSLIALENSASTSRVLNLRKIFLESAQEPTYKEQSFFENPVLNRSIILKHRLRINECDDFVMPRTVVTKLVIPLDITDLRVGAQYIFVGQRNFEKMLSGSIEKYDLNISKDLETLSILDTIPTLDPFILREQLSRNGVRPASCYFQIAGSDVARMLTFAQAEIGELVKMSVGAEGTGEQIAILTQKLLSTNGASETEGLRLTLQMDRAQYREGIFCWKAFLYYKWQLKDLLPKIKVVMSEIDRLVPQGHLSSDQKIDIANMKKNISRGFGRAIKSVSETLSIYDNAYHALTKQSDPQIFKNFLLSAPELFSALGERLGAVEHLSSFWRFRFPLGKRSQITVDDLIDMFSDFESSLEIVSEQADPPKAIWG
jgi:hypothetical protein